MRAKRPGDRGKSLKSFNFFFKSLKVCFHGYVHICAFFIFMVSFIGKVKRGETVSSRQNGKVKAEHWSPFQCHHDEPSQCECAGIQHSAPFTAGVELSWDPEPHPSQRFVLSKGCHKLSVLGAIAAKLAGRETPMGKALDGLWRKKKKKTLEKDLGFGSRKLSWLLIPMRLGGERQLHASPLTNGAASYFPLISVPSLDLLASENSRKMPKVAPK